jgi:hypothetical protein
VCLSPKASGGRQKTGIRCNIFETLSREAQIFKYGSGAGANFSKIREKGAPLSSGGQSSGARARIGAWRSATRCVAVGMRAITPACMLCHGWPNVARLSVAARRDMPIARKVFAYGTRRSRPGLSMAALGNDHFILQVASLTRQLSAWKGTATELRDYILYLLGQNEPGDARVPASPSAVGATLRRFLPAPRAEGIDVMLDDCDPGTGRRRIKLRVVD